jgi:hypothetical protein
MSISAGELAKKLEIENGEKQPYVTEQEIFAALENLAGDASKLEKRDSDKTVILEAQTDPDLLALEEEGASDAETVIVEQQPIGVQERKSESEKQAFEHQQRIEGQKSWASRLLWPVKKKPEKHKKTESSNADEDRVESHKPKKLKIQEEGNKISRARSLGS